MTQEVLKLALDALEEYVNVVVSVNDPNEWTPKVADAGEPARKAITAIKEALREHAMREVQRLGQEIEQEPVVWMYQDKSTHEVRFQKHMRDFVDHGATYETPLYTTPPQRTWVGLTDEDRQAAFESMPDMLDGFLKTWGWLHFSKALEAKLKQLNT